MTSVPEPAAAAVTASADPAGTSRAMAETRPRASLP